MARWRPSDIGWRKRYEQLRSRGEPELLGELSHPAFAAELPGIPPYAPKGGSGFSMTMRWPARAVAPAGEVLIVVGLATPQIADPQYRVQLLDGAYLCPGGAGDARHELLYVQIPPRGSYGVMVSFDETASPSPAGQVQVWGWRVPVRNIP